MHCTIFSCTEIDNVFFSCPFNYFIVKSIKFVALFNIGTKTFLWGSQFRVSRCRISRQNLFWCRISEQNLLQDINAKFYILWTCKNLKKTISSQHSEINISALDQDQRDQPKFTLLFRYLTILPLNLFLEDILSCFAWLTKNRVILEKKILSNFQKFSSSLQKLQKCGKWHFECTKKVE